MAKTKKKKAKVALKSKINSQEKIDTRFPRMFSDEPIQEKLKAAVRISDLKNLGASAERAFKDVGIVKASQLVEMGWKKAMLKLIAHDPKHNHLIFARAIIGALQNKDWLALDAADLQDAKIFLQEQRNKKKSLK